MPNPVCLQACINRGWWSFNTANQVVCGVCKDEFLQSAAKDAVCERWDGLGKVVEQPRKVIAIALQKWLTAAKTKKITEDNGSGYLSHRLRKLRSLHHLGSTAEPKTMGALGCHTLVEAMIVQSFQRIRLGEWRLSSSIDHQTEIRYAIFDFPPFCGTVVQGRNFRQYDTTNRVPRQHPKALFIDLSSTWYKFDLL